MLSLSGLSKKVLLKEAAKIAGSVSLGFLVFWLTSHPGSPIHRKIPARKLRNLHIFPHIKFNHRDNTYHFHHWFNLSTLALLTFVAKRELLGYRLLQGFLLGGILQGLSYKDRHRFVYKTLNPQ